MVLQYMMEKLKRILLKPSRMKKRATRQVLPTTSRGQVWLKVYGKTFLNKCFITWCSNDIAQMAPGPPSFPDGVTGHRGCEGAAQD